jgi:hypothetical protein
MLGDDRASPSIQDFVFAGFGALYDDYGLRARPT